MDRSRIHTTLRNYASGGALAEGIREDARVALDDLQVDPGYDPAVVRLSGHFSERSVTHVPGLEGLEEVLSFAFRAGLKLGLSIGAVGEPGWELECESWTHKLAKE